MGAQLGDRLMSTDAEQWGVLKKRLSAVPLVTRPEPYVQASQQSDVGFGAVDVKRIARFIVDVYEGDRKKSLDLAARFQRDATDRIFGRAVAVAVHQHLNQERMRPHRQSSHEVE